jgi:hypothetical protein
MYLVLIQSAMTALTGGRLRWHKLQRAGLTQRQEVAVTIPSQKAAAPEVDTWPPVLDRVVGSSRHPAAGRATARPAVPTQTTQLGAEDLPSAGSPPGGEPGSVYTG